MGRSWQPPGPTRSIRIWNPADGKLIKEITTGEPTVAVGFHQDGSQLAVALANKSVRDLLGRRRQGAKEGRKGAVADHGALRFAATVPSSRSPVRTT